MLLAKGKRQSPITEVEISDQPLNFNSNDGEAYTLHYPVPGESQADPSILREIIDRLLVAGESQSTKFRTRVKQKSLNRRRRKVAK